MSPHTKLILLTLFCTFLHISLGENKCEECMTDNEAYCVDKTSYYLCMNGKPLKSTLTNCPEDHVCTNSDKICEPESVANKPICDSSCNKCPTDGKYTCVSKTQFGRCIDNEVVIVSSCESGSICNIDMLVKAGQICAPTCVVDFFGLSATCSNDKPIATTVAPPTTSNVSNLKQKCKDNEQNKKIYYVINDTECKTYIYCEKVDDDVEALLMKCSNGFYDVNLNKCVKQQPEGCGANTSSPGE
ncbi:uncharacterized protein LOC135961902 [Calliphora vicina]|uniref:uncharacterized protein LOC135961902 n=1 Tax=Calliphora vicina TaxID=7373 RepID=UPI00325AD52A